MRRGLRPLTSTRTNDEPLTVTQLTRAIKGALEGSFDRVTVEGEIGNLTLARSGHIYLTLKDAGAVIDAVIWKSSASRLRVEPREGEKVIARGALTVYEPRGRYQLVATQLEPVGKGDLQARFEALVAKLRVEGLFDPERKQPIPKRPRTVGVVTSATGAAVRDIIKVIQRRNPAIRIVLSPCKVQGEGAATEIVAALERLERWGEAEVIIVGRGGGSLEDLWAFNEEPVARAIAAARTPIVSGVGHEVDISIADLVADLRAATPSEAAEAVAPDLRESFGRILHLKRALALALAGPLREARHRLNVLQERPVIRRPLEMIRMRQQRLDHLAEAFTRCGNELVKNRDQRLRMAAARLEALSPLGVLARGYSVTRHEDGTVLRAASEARIGERVTTHLATGRIASTVAEIVGD